MCLLEFAFKTTSHWVFTTILFTELANYYQVNPTEIEKLGEDYTVLTFGKNLFIKALKR